MHGVPFVAHWQTVQTLGSHILHRLKNYIVKNMEKIFLSETIRPKSLDIWYVASPSGPTPSLFKLYPWGQKWPCPGVT